MKRLPFFFSSPPRSPGGFTLAELCVVLAITALCLSWAVPSLSQWFWRLRVDSAVHTWAGDLQASRLQAMRRGEYLQLQRLTHCLAQPLPQGDWRCGWQLVPKSQAAVTPVLVSALSGELRVQLYPAQNSLDINPMGEAVVGGLRMVVQARGSQTSLRSICINITGRLRVVNGASCS